MPTPPTSADAAVYAYPGRIYLPSDHERASAASLTATLKGRNLVDPALLEERPPFFFRTEISNTRLDAYWTWMDKETSLRNFAAETDAAPGISLQNSHMVRQLGFGRSLTGTFINAQGNGVARVVSDFYTVPGLKLNDVSTTDLIDGIRSGMIADVSVGFYGAKFICSICNRDMMSDYNCWHVPGFKYNKEKPDDWQTDPEGEIATARIDDAHLAEVSMVYDGATPGAMVTQIYRANEAGHLSRSTALLLEEHYRIRLPAAQVRVAGYSPREEPMAANTDRKPGTASAEEHDAPPPAVVNNAPADGLAGVRAALQTAGVPAEHAADPIAGIRWLVTERERLMPFQTQVAMLEGQVRNLTEQLPDPNEQRDLAAMRQELETLRPLAEEVRQLRPIADEAKRLREQVAEIATIREQAEDGKTYRADLVAEALRQGARAFGDEFQPAIYEPLLQSATLSTVKRFIADWKRAGDALLPSGRQSQDEEDAAADDAAADADERAAPEQDSTPALAYRDH